MTADRSAGVASLELPSVPNVDHLRKQARQLLRDYRNREPEALSIVTTFHPRPTDFSSLRDAQLTLARRYSLFVLPRPIRTIAV